MVLATGVTINESLFTLNQFEIAIISMYLKSSHGGAVAEWVSALAWTGDRVVLAGFESRGGNFASELWQFPLPRATLPVSFGGDKC